MSDLQPKGIKLTIDGTDRELFFTLRAVDDIQSHFSLPVSSVINKLSSEEGIYEVLPYLVAVLANEGSRRNGIEERLTEDDIKGAVTVPELSRVTAAVLRSYGIAIPESEDDDPNATSRSN